MIDLSPCEEPENDVLKTIYERRSVRDYRDEPLSDELIRNLIWAAVQAPSAANKQPWRFVVIKNKAAMKKISDKAKELWVEESRDSNNTDLIMLAQMVSRPDFNIFFNAPLLIMIFAHPDSFSPQYDCSLAAQNMMLAAKSLGLGSCWIGLAAPVERVATLMRELGVPEGYSLIAPLIFGYPAKERLKGPTRKTDVILNWIE
jgi:nitroreductase